MARWQGKLEEIFLAFALALAFALPASAQRPVWVYLQPDALRYAPFVTGVRQRETFANDRAIPRSLIERIARTGAHVRVASRWLQAVSVDADAAAVTRISHLHGIRAIVPVRQMLAQAPDAQLAASQPGSVMRAARSDGSLAAGSFASAVDFDSAFYGPNWKAIKMLGIPSSHALGFTGKGVKIALLDTGFEPAHDALKTRNVIATRDFINGDSNVADQPGDVPSSSSQEIHGTWTWSVLGGYQPGSLVGPAFDAAFILAKTDINQLGDPDFKADEDRWVAALEWADSVGANVVSSSLAYRDFVDAPSYPVSALNGNTTAVARAADEAARRGVLIVNAMGNFGPAPTSLWSPADADSVIAVGAVDMQGTLWDSSSRGPSADGRLKPEVVAPGVAITAADAHALSSYNSVTGTSPATPFVAGAAAMFMQAWPNLTIMAVQRALRESATRADAPDNSYGYGVPDVSSAILFPEGLEATAVSEKDLNNVLTTIQPSFTWTAPLVQQRMRPVHFKLEVATDKEFSNVIYSDTTDFFTLTVKRPLRPAPALYWRVIASAFPNVTRVARAQVSFAMPDWVKLTTLNQPSPELTDSVRPLLKWDPLAAPPPSGPLTYEVQVLNSSSNQIVQDIRNLTSASVQLPDPLVPNISYKWRVIARSVFVLNGAQIADTVTSTSTFTVRSSTNPATTLLYQNFPNPFPRRDLGETSTHVWFDVTTASKIQLAVYDVRGRLIKRLIPSGSSCGEVVLQPGAYGRGSDGVPCVSTSWDGTDTSGAQVPRGVYILRLRAGGREEVKRILYLP